MLYKTSFKWLLLGVLYTSVFGGQGSSMTRAATFQQSVFSGAVSFDVASIKPSNPDTTGFTIRPDPNNFTVTGATLRYLVQYAYDVDDYQVKGGPSWVSSARFDIIAKSDSAEVAASTSNSRDERDKVLQQRLQHLLEERFGLKVHQEKKLVPGYALISLKSGLKVQPPKAGGGYTFAQGLLVCNDFSLSELADMLASILRRPVGDKTEDHGRYSFTLKWSPDELRMVEDGPPGLFTAIQEQLGLKLESDKEPGQIVVIDSVTQPSIN